MPNKKDILQQSEKESAIDADREAAFSAAQTKETEKTDKESPDTAGGSDTSSADKRSGRKARRKDKKKNKEGARKRSWFQTKIAAGIAVLLTTVSAILFFTVIWAFTTWAGLKMDEILFHLKTPLEGTGGGIIAHFVTR